MKEFITRYLQWVKDNGVSHKPKQTKSDGNELGGAHKRSTLIVWEDGDREPLRQAVEVMMLGETPLAGLQEVQAYYGLPVTVTKPWNAPSAPENTNPIVVNPPLPTKPVGAPIPGRPDCYEHEGGRDDQALQSIYTDETGTYKYEADGMFTRFWRKIG